MIAAIALAGLVLAAGLSGRLGLGGAAALAGMSLVWLLVNSPMEGPVLVTVTRGHGLTGGDLAGIIGFALAVVRAMVLTRRPRSGG